MAQRLKPISTHPEDLYAHDPGLGVSPWRCLLTPRPEGVGQLPPERFGDRFGDAEVGWHFVLGKIEGAKEHVPGCDESGEIFIDGFGFLGVVPAMEVRTGDDVAQGAEIPVEIGMKKNRVERDEGKVCGQRSRIISGKKEGNHLHGSRQRLVQRMKPDAAEPVDIGRAMMHGVKGPEASAMKKAVHPIANQIGQEKNLESLQPERLPGERAKAMVTVGLKRLPGESENENERNHGEDNREARDEAGDQRREEPVEHVQAETPAKKRLRTPTGTKF